MGDCDGCRHALIGPGSLSLRGEDPVEPDFEGCGLPSVGEMYRDAGEATGILVEAAMVAVADLGGCKWREGALGMPPLPSRSAPRSQGRGTTRSYRETG